MQSLATIVRLIPWAFFRRLTTALIEVLLAAVLLSSSVVVGHELRDWRTWYTDAVHPWAPTARPTMSPAPETRMPLGLRP